MTTAEGPPQDGEVLKGDVYCVASGCPHKAKDGPWCPGHRKQMQRRGRITGPIPGKQSKRDLLREAAIAYHEADTDEEFARADARLAGAAINLAVAVLPTNDRLRKAAIRLAVSLGYVRTASRDRRRVGP